MGSTLPGLERPFVSIDTALEGDATERRFVVGATAGVVASFRRDLPGSPELTVTPHREGLVRVSLSLPLDRSMPQVSAADVEPEISELDPSKALRGHRLRGSVDWEAGSLVAVTPKSPNRGPLVVVEDEISQLHDALGTSRNRLGPYVAKIIEAANRAMPPR